MKNWIINEKETTNQYLIATQKSIWISEQLKELDINKLIHDKNLGKVKSLRYEEIKEIIFIDTDFSIEFVFKDSEVEKITYSINKSVFRQIKTYFKKHLSGIKIKDYSLLKQVLPQLTTLTLGLVFLSLTYSTALDLENGLEIPESSKSSIIKKIILVLAELVGASGSIILGVIFSLIFIFLITKKLQNPKKGEVLRLDKTSKLKTA